jgi:hypothetical protein
MAHQPRYVRSLRKRDAKELIIWLIGCHASKTIQGPDGPMSIKAEDFQASTNEILRFLNSNLVSDGNHRLSIPRRTLHNYLEELDGEYCIQQPEKGLYVLTDTGMKKWALINLISKARNTLLTQEPIGTFFAFGPKEDGQTKYVDIVIRIQDLDLVKILRDAVAEQRISENEKELGRLLSTVIMWYTSGIFSRINSLIDGHEDVFLDLMKNLPFRRK